MAVGERRSTACRGRLIAIRRPLRSIGLLALTTVVCAACPDKTNNVERDADADNPAVLYVDASAAPGGDGSAGRPFVELSEAVDAAPPGSTIEMAAGQYDGLVTIDRSVTITGSGVLTQLGSPGWEPALILVGDSRVRLFDLQIFGLTVEGGDLYLGSVLLTGRDHPALSASGAIVEMDGGAVRDAESGGIEVTGGQLVLRNAELESTPLFGIDVVDAVSVIIFDTFVRELPGPVIRLEGSESELQGLRVEDVGRPPAETGSGQPTGADAVQIVGGHARITRSSFARIEGSAIEFRGATGEVVESSVAGVGRSGVAFVADSSGAGSEGEISDSTFEEGFGTGILVAGSDLHATTNVFRRWQDQAISVSSDSTARIADNTFVDLGGDGIAVVGAGQVALSRNRMVTVDGICISVIEQSEPLVIEDNSLKSCRPSAVRVEGSSGVRLVGNAVDGTRALGMSESAGIILAHGSDVAVEGNDISSNDGHGLLAVDGVRAGVVENRFERNGGFGVNVICPTGEVEASEVEMTDNVFADNDLGPSSICP